ncbi:MAG: FkbM family methyltransferase [Fuerstiella sp.]|nr:FkbM family methyltransferase [Fuerstiella sp.]
MSTVLSELLVKPVTKFYRRTILKDPFLVAVRQWKRDRGDATLRQDYSLDETSVVLDVGGYQGDFAQAMLDRFGCRVFVFEPMPGFAEQCRQRFADEPRVSVLDYGLGARDERLSLSESDDASSFCRDSGTVGSVSAQIRDVGSVWEELGIEQVDLMKVNIEGGEYPLLGRLIESRLIQQVQNLQVQFHDFVADANRQRNELRQQLAPSHTETWCYEFVWENWSRIQDAA